MLDASALDLLRDRLQDAGYTADAVLERLGEPGRRGLDRNSTRPARDALAGADDPQATLARLWILQDAVPLAALDAALGAAVAALTRAGMLAPAASGQGMTATAVVRPYGETDNPDAPPAWICHDPLPNLDGRNAAPRPDHVLGVSPASVTLAQIAARRPVGSALDLGTGCGVQALHLAAHAGRVVATDLNPRALDLAKVTWGLSGIAPDARLGSLYEPVAGETFDQIVSNPPFVMSPPAGERLVYREGSLPGDELVRRVVVDGARRLAPGGTLQVLTNWAITAGRPWDERLADWLRPTGCDALVLQRERLDPHEYVEIWLSDAGLDRAPDYAERYAAWLDYLDAQRIEGIGMGWIALSNAGRLTPDVRLEDWPFDVHQPVGEALAGHSDRATAAARPTDAFLAARWRLHPGVVQEAIGRPGAPDPEHIVLRQRFGLGRAVEADTALAAAVGACDGELALAQIVPALASLLDVAPDALAAGLLPRLRELVADGYLV